MAQPPAIHHVLDIVHEHLQATRLPWLLGGSVGLMLRGITITKDPRDLDIYIDQLHFATVHQALQSYALHTPQFSATPIYQSTLSHYHITGVQVEVVGSFSVNAFSCEYKVEVAELATHYPAQVQLTSGTWIPVIPLAHEYVFNRLRQRPDRYLEIAKHIKQNIHEHLPALTFVLERNVWTPEIIAQFAHDLGITLRTSS
jgi:hypothetical protein